MTPRLCPACRIPRPPVQVHVGEEEGRFVVFGLCSPCASRYQKLPRQTRQKLLNGAVARTAANTSPYYAATFDDLGAALLAEGLIAHPRYACAALVAIGWIER